LHECWDFTRAEHNRRRLRNRCGVEIHFNPKIILRPFEAGSNPFRFVSFPMSNSISNRRPTGCGRRVNPTRVCYGRSFSFSSGQSGSKVTAPACGQPFGMTPDRRAWMYRPLHGIRWQPPLDTLQFSHTLHRSIRSATSSGYRIGCCCISPCWPGAGHVGSIPRSGTATGGNAAPIVARCCNAVVIP